MTWWHVHDWMYVSRPFRYDPDTSHQRVITEVGINSPRWRVSWMCQGIIWLATRGAESMGPYLNDLFAIGKYAEMLHVSNFFLKEDFRFLEIGLCMMIIYFVLRLKLLGFFFHRGRSTCMPTMSCLIEAQSKKINKSWDFSCHFLSVIPWKFQNSHRLGHLRRDDWHPGWLVYPTHNS